MGGQLEFAHTRITEIKEGSEAEKAEIRRLSVENERKDNKIASKVKQLNRQLLIVSKLTEQNDKWQEQLEILSEEKEELTGNLADATNEAISLREELTEANRNIDELN